ncbi:MAG TPA: ABC transporter ATP-binding protein [Gammaproteobacteria bacterium]|nr:ABC transporter ATP-binding protein [Gammaproteobacteria bacterium]
MNDHDDSANWRNYAAFASYTRRALALVWSTHRTLTIVMAVATIAAGLLPAAAAKVGQLIVDSVVAAIDIYETTGTADYSTMLWLVGIEGVIVAALMGSQRAIDFCRSLLRVLLSQRVNTMILEKALTLQLSQFEDSEFYDKLNRARQEASSRPLGLVNATFTLARNAISLIGYAALLIQFSAWAVLVLVLAGIPVFLSEVKFSGEKFRVFRWRSQERRMLMYLEIVLAREDHAKEVQLFNLGERLLGRYRDIFRKLYDEERGITIRRDTWGFLLSLLSSAAFYGAYAWIGYSTITGSITIGEMTMYLVVFRQGQSAVSAILSSIGGMYEDNLYLSNLYEYLEQPASGLGGTATQGADPGDGLRFENVWFSYPGSSEPALKGVSLHLHPGQSVALVGPNGCGKTTLVKLLAGLYEPDKGVIRYRGTPLSQWSPRALRDHIGVIFQDYARYHFKVGENIGAGDELAFDDQARWRDAASKGQAAEFIERLPATYDTQLGRWFFQGQELSGGQWQRIALARAFMRKGAEILVLDEPTAAMDAETEAAVFKHFQQLTRNKISVLISHRFSTVREADLIVVMDEGRIVEQGTHEELVAHAGRYARLFELQAQAYR